MNNKYLKKFPSTLFHFIILSIYGIIFIRIICEQSKYTENEIIKPKSLIFAEAKEKQFAKSDTNKEPEYFENIENLKSNNENNFTNKKNIRTRKEYEEDNLFKEWDDKVSKMHAHDLLTLKLNSKDSLVFFEDFEKTPENFTIAFYLHEERRKIDFFVIAPNGKIIFNLKSKSRGFYEYTIKETGTYEFHLSNKRNKKENKVTFAFHTTKEEMKLISTVQITDLHFDIAKVEKEINEMQFNQKMLNIKYESHFEFIKKHNKNITFWSMLETSLMCIIVIFQLFYIKNLLDRN